MNKLSCLILAGGEGTRLRPLTISKPKPLIKVAGKSIIDYSIKLCSHFKIDDFYILTGYLSQQIEKHFQDKKYPKLNIKTIDTGDVDIIERIKSTRLCVESDYLLILYGDTISDVNIPHLLDFHINNGTLATITTWEIASSFGVISSNDSNIVESYLEKPKLDIWINIGYIVLSKDCYEIMEDFDSFEKFLRHLVSLEELSSYKHHGMHLTINNLHELNLAERKLKDFDFDF